MRELGTAAPAFTLPNMNNQAGPGNVSLADFHRSKALLVVFMCNHCPYVIHIREALVKFAKEYQERGVAVVAINANDVEHYPADGPDKMAEDSARFNYSFPYLYDESQSAAKAYGAACTPDFFLFDGNQRLVYRGQFDSSRPNSGIPVTGNDLRAALDAVLAGDGVPDDQKPSMGCNIKWKPGNTPSYFAAK